MKVINNDRERDKIYLRSNIQSCITNITNESNKLQETISILQNAVGGSPSGIDGKLIGRCKQALEQISIGLQNLNQSIQFINQIDTYEEISDGEH